MKRLTKKKLIKYLEENGYQTSEAFRGLYKGNGNKIKVYDDSFWYENQSGVKVPKYQETEILKENPLTIKIKVEINF